MKKKILIVEDNSANMRILEMTLRAKDHILLMATDGEEALAKAVMAMMGVRLNTRLFLSLRVTSSPFNLGSWMSIKMRFGRSFNAVASAYLPKPIDIHHLRKVIAGMLLQKQKVCAGKD